ncbi:MAG: [NiFe]-hydrogenase assembly chaperone HybE [Woeseiaceae bacterium]|nr:[NiFe]-hydrogenase assembly chaperone HybE [Woeseiaceae bacterium]
MGVGVPQLVDYYGKVYRDRIHDLPIINSKLEVEAVGFRKLDEHEFGVLITPWFMNLVLLPGTDRWQDRTQGTAVGIDLPGAKLDFTVAHDDKLGTILTAALFGTVTSFPGQAMARDVARETLRLLFTSTKDVGRGSGRTMSRRELLKQLGGVLGDQQ